MSETVGNLSFPDSQYTKAYSEKVEGMIDLEIQKIIKKCTEITMGMIVKH